MADYTEEYYARSYARSGVQPGWPALPDGHKVSVASICDAALVEAELQPPHPKPEPPPSGGWLLPEPAAGALIVYVSNDGSDANSGHSPQSALRTISEAKREIRPGHPDRILLRRGDTFPSLERWEHSGRSPTEPAVLGAYGTGPRPKLGGIIAQNEPLSFVAIAGIECGEEGLRWHTPGAGILFEDVVVRGGGEGCTVQRINHSGVTTLTDVRLNRCILLDGHGQGAYIWGIDGIAITDCAFIHNGHPATQLVHNLYMAENNSGVVIRNTISAFGGSHDMQLRSGCDAEDILCYGGAIHLLLGGGDSPNPLGVVANMRRFVLMGAGDINDAEWRGWACEVRNVRQGEMTDGIIADVKGRMPISLAIDARYTGGTIPAPPGVRNFRFHRVARRGWPCGNDALNGRVPKVGPGVTEQYAYANGYLWQADSPDQTTGTSVEGFNERTDLAGIDIGLEAFSPGLIDWHRNRAAGAWDEARSARAYTKWARTKFGMEQP